MIASPRDANGLVPTDSSIPRVLSTGTIALPSKIQVLVGMVGTPGFGGKGLGDDVGWAGRRAPSTGAFRTTPGPPPATSGRAPQPISRRQQHQSRGSGIGQPEVPVHPGRDGQLGRRPLGPGIRGPPSRWTLPSGLIARTAACAGSRNVALSLTAILGSDRDRGPQQVAQVQPALAVGIRPVDVHLPAGHEVGQPLARIATASRHRWTCRFPAGTGGLDFGAGASARFEGLGGRSAVGAGLASATLRGPAAGAKWA